jgi:hypothetical protein
VKNDNFTIISNVFLKDTNLSIKAKGFLAVVMGLPNDWEFSINGVCSILKEGKTAIYSIIDELKNNGYCSVVMSRDEKGRITGSDYTFYEEPQADEPYTESPNTESPNTDNQPQLSTYNINDLFNEELKEKEDESSSKKEPTWRDDFNIFLGLVNSAKEQLLLDKKCKAKMELYYPNLNYELSLQKMVDDYWGTEEGWQKKKKSPKKDANIDMVKTLKNGFSRHYNRLYKRTTTQSFSTYIPQKVSDRAMDYISTLTVPVQTERDGIKYLIDGTFVEDGKRYYTHSIKGKMEISMGAVARPSEDWEWNSNMLTWEQDERKTTISDMLF